LERFSNHTLAEPAVERRCEAHAEHLGQVHRREREWYKAPVVQPSRSTRIVMTTRLKYRPFLDGLRAVAVLVVIFYHLDLTLFRGGFLGVDVFFVLSGYLITSLLLVEKAATERIDFVNFYMRRAKRLLPALFLVVLVLVTVGRAVYAVDAQSIVARDALATLCYVANWSFILHEQSYFDAFAEPSPLRHMWSLAIEEQFYLVWPLVLLAVLAVRSRGFAVVLALTAISAVALAVLHDPSDPSRAYYGTDTRLHEISIGALTALLLVRRGKPPKAARYLAMPSFAVIIGFVVLLGDKDPGYYWGLSTVFCLATAVLIVSLEAPGSLILKSVLSSRPFVWIGKISYGMYLWHWPIIVALYQVPIANEVVRTGIAVGATVAVSTASYFCIERPIRHAKSILGRPLTGRATLTVAAVAFSIVAVPVGFALQSSSQPAWGSDELTISGQGEYRIAVIGDSLARSLVPGLETLGAERGWAIVNGAMGGCSIAGGYQVNFAGEGYSFSNRCARAVPDAFETVAEVDPDLVIWHSASETNSLMDVNTGEVYHPGSEGHDAIIRAGWERAVRHFQGVPVVAVGVVHNGPRRRSLCGDTPNCGADDGTNGYVDHLNSLLKEFADAHANVQFVSVSDFVCPSGPPCARTVEGVELRPDGSHYTEETATAVVEEILSKTDAYDLPSSVRSRRP
jgi:peptidoglycan/LPS O-acetylase OafA/YrhL